MLGPLGPGDAVVSIGVVADPLLGEIFAAAFVPLRLEALDPEHAGERAWLVICHANPEGCLRLDVPREWWRDADGVLVLLVYDYSSLLDDRAPATLAGHMTRFAPERKLGSEPIPVKDLPEAMRQEMLRTLRSRLSARHKFEAGVVELPPQDAPGLAFAVASCQYPAGFLDGDPAERSYRKLARCLDRRRSPLRPQLVLLLGDQVYADPTAGLFDPSAEHDRFALPHQRLLAMPSFRSVARRVPVHAMLDDHEIEDNWEPEPGKADNADKLAKGRAAYVQYQRLADPRVALPGAPLWHEFELNGVPFFVADTRTERKPRDAASVGRAHIMDGDTQLAALLKWLDSWRESRAPKFIACPALPLPRHRRAAQRGVPASALRSDAWDGYPASLERLLTKIVEAQVSNVVFLSGDEHVSLVAKAVLRLDGRKPIVVHSVHSSALYAPYPFANSIDEDLDDVAPFRIGGCSVEGMEIRFAAPGDGFALLQVLNKDGRWLTRCRFLRGPRAPGTGKWNELEP